MRRPRIKNEIEGYYHIVSRCVLRQFLFNEKDKDMFVKMMRRAEFFSGVKILSYCIMSNHFHILAHIKKEKEITEEMLIKRIEVLYGDYYTIPIKARWQQYKEDNDLKKLKEEQDVFRARMGDLSEFVKTLKQRYSVWYCHEHKYDGTIWQGRFRSTLIEGSSEELSTVGAYIDLNPIRAGIVQDPKDYRWSSYGSAVAGDYKSMIGISSIYKREEVNPVDFTKEYGAIYRLKLYLDGSEILDKAEVQKTIKNKGKLPLPVLLRCKVRYFTYSSILGSRDFVNQGMKDYAYAFGDNRKTKASRVANSSEKIYSARGLQKDRVTIA